MKSNTADYLTQIETLTKTNLQILKALNDSFFTKKDHLFAEVNDTTYVIPSFISLENKINMLQENFENLIKAPETSEAYFNFDGNTRSIEVRKYNYTPDSIVMPTVESYSVDNNDIFKDFMTPVPYINLELPSIPNDIIDINVKKIVPKSDSLKELFSNLLSYTTKDEEGNDIKNYHISSNASYANVYKLLLNYKEDVDFVEYDTIYKLPVRKNIGNATYVIESVVSDIIDDDLNEIITLKLRKDLKDNKYTNKLTYKLFDETIEKPLQVGDELVNYDGTGKVIITEVKPITNTIVVKVVNGEYLNFLGTDSYDTDSDKDIHDLSKIRFYSPVDYTSDKYIKIPLEEDKYVFIAAAPLNARMNVQASWGTGLVINTYSLTNSNYGSFKTHYDKNVKNIGDVLFEMTSMITSPITKLSKDEFNTLISYKPAISEKSLSVMQINKHLNNSETVKNIRDAYNQKKLAEKELTEIQDSIADINSKLSTISFEDTTGIRLVYSSQLSQLNEKKNAILTTITNAIDSISTNVNSSEIPIENAKYRIRGFIKPEVNDVIQILVQYRYKNLSTALGNAVSISADNNKTYIYSDWNVLQTTKKNKLVSQNENGEYVYAYEQDNENINEPSYNQIDIPISQGETVDIRVKYLYAHGQPFSSVTTDWSNIINISFPSEFTKEVPILTIIEENNNDIETNRFNNILNDYGVSGHINDRITDQNVTYFHGPDNIASGFYTEERRIIPLKDKLQSIHNDISELKSTILGSEDNYAVNVILGNANTTLYHDRENIITLDSYKDITTNNTSGIVNNGAYVLNDGGVVSTIINLSISNTSNSTLKLYSLFPGNRNISINKTNSTVVNKEDYSSGSNGGVYYKYKSDENDKNVVDKTNLQGQNQFIMFRINDVWTHESYYDSNSIASTHNKQSIIGLPKIDTNTTNAQMTLYPFVSTKYGLCIDSDDIRTYLSVNPGEEVIIPIYCEYMLKNPNTSIQKTISFDIRTNLYSKPTNYTFTVVAKNTASIQDRLTIVNKNRLWDRFTKKLSKYNITVK